MPIDRDAAMDLIAVFNSGRVHNRMMVLSIRARSDVALFTSIDLNAITASSYIFFSLVMCMVGLVVYIPCTRASRTLLAIYWACQSVLVALIAPTELPLHSAEPHNHKQRGARGCSISIS